MEARILAGQDDNTIAGLFGTLPDAIKYYELLFFNVRDRLDKQDFILGSLLRDVEALLDPADLSGTMTIEQKLVAMRLMGYLGGPQVIDAMVSGGLTGRQHAAAGQADRWFRDAFGQMLRHKGALAAFQIGIDRHNNVQVLQLQREDQQQAVAAGGGVSAGGISAEGLMESLKQIPWCMAVRDTENVPPAIKHFRESAVEPRAAEWLALGYDVVPLELLHAEMNNESRQDAQT